MSIPIYRPFLPAKSLSYAHEAIDSTWISSQGKYIQMVADKLQELLGVKYVLPVFNGTCACHLVAKCISNRNDMIYRIIVPDNVYVAAWNSFLFDATYELICVPCDLNTWNYDLDALDKTINRNPDAAVLIVHNIGNIVNVPKLQLKYPNTLFVEDNCEGLLGSYDGVKSGTASYASAVSFYGNKTLTSGEGGAIITNDENAYLFAKCVQGQGQSKQRFIHNELGYNYRMTNIQAAILYGQLELTNTIADMKRSVFDTYRNALKNREDVLLQSIEPGTEHSNWMFGVRVPGHSNYEAAELYFRQEGIEIRPMFYPITAHMHIVRRQNVSIGDCSNADTLNKECFILPSYPDLKQSEQSHILNVLNNYLGTLK